MQTKRTLAVLLSAALIATAMTGCSSAQTSSSTGAAIATYTQGSLSESALTDELLSKAGMQMMLDMVDKEILDSVEPVSDEMIAEADSNLANIKNYYQEDFETSLQLSGFDGEEDFKNSLLLGSQRQAYTLKYIAANLLTEEEINAYYENYEPSIEASHILIKPENDTPEAVTSAEQKAKDLIARIEKGEDFAELAKEFSEDPGSSLNGGALGEFRKGDMVAEFEDAAFSLKIGEVTKEPVKSQFGYHIIKKTAGIEKTTLEEMRDTITKNLANEKLQADQTITYKALIQLRKDNGFEIKNETIAKQYSIFLDQMSKNEN